jgi:hypothetical protein
MRISVQPAHTPACKNFRHGWRELARLRKLGVDPDHCIAVEKLDAPTARTRLLARSTKVFNTLVDGREGFALWRFDVVGGELDAQQQVQPAIRVVDHAALWLSAGKGYSGWAWGCPDRDARARALDAAIAGRGNPALHPPEVVVVPATEPAVEETEASDADIAQLRWLERARCSGGAATYDAAGTLWIEDIDVGGKRRQALHVLKDRQLLVAPMPVNAGQEPPLFAGEVAVLMHGRFSRTALAGPAWF